MPIYDFLIAVAGEIDHTIGKYRKKEGDIVAVRRHGHNWGRKEIDEYLIVPVECEEEDLDFMRQLFERPLLEADHVEGRTFREIWPELDGQETFDQYHETHVIALPSGQLMLRPQYLGKNKYKIPLDSLGDIDLVKVRDKRAVYQPFLKASHVVKKFDGLNNNRYLELKDVDCTAPLMGIGSEDEANKTWLSDTDQVIVNKADDTYLKPKVKSVSEL